MSRLSRKNREDIEFKNHGGLNDAFDDALKSTWRINDKEYDYICEYASDDEISLIVNDDFNFSEGKRALKLVDRLLNQMYTTYDSGYMVKTLENYPPNGKHLECYINLPFEIRKGQDGYYWKDKDGEHSYNIFEDDDKIDNRWIVHLKPEANPSLVDIFKVKMSENLDEIIGYCVDLYKKSLEMEMDRVDTELGKKIVKDK